MAEQKGGTFHGFSLLPRWGLGHGVQDGRLPMLELGEAVGEFGARLAKVERGGRVGGRACGWLDG